MTTLSDFDDATQELLVSLPYAVGIYVSYADDDDGEGDDELEMQALEACLTGISKLHEGQPLVSEIVRQTLSRKEDWTRWAPKAFQVPKLAEQAIQAILVTGTEANAKNYRAALMEIASSVAQAHGEFGEFEDEPEDGFLGGLVNKIVGGFSQITEDDAGHPANVSAAEDSAIETLRQALKI